MQDPNENANVNWEDQMLRDCQAAIYTPAQVTLRD